MARPATRANREAYTEPATSGDTRPRAGVAEDVLEELAARSLPIAHRVAAISRRRDVLDKRARLCLLLLRLRCPPDARPTRSWYQPGAVARMGADGLMRVWRRTWPQEPISKRTVQRHLGALQRAAIIVRQPGDWIPIMSPDPNHPERRPRYPDTIHVLAGESEVAWWTTAGRELLERRPDTRHNPTAWLMVFGDWRRRAAQAETLGGQGLLFDEEVPEPVRQTASEREEALRKATVLRAALRQRADPLELSRALALAGATIRGRNSFEVLRRFERLEGASAMMVLALERGDRVRNPGGWIVRAWKYAARGELQGALAAVRCRRSGR